MLRIGLPVLLIVFSSFVFAQETVHVLRKGDTLYGLAKKYGVSYDALVRENGIRDADRIQVGQKIRIPSSPVPALNEGATRTETVKHKVGKGETLFGISRRYGVSVAALRASNGLGEKSLLKEGDVLIVTVPTVTEKPEVAEKPAATEKPAVTSEAKPGHESEARALVSKSTDPGLLWPIKPKAISYMSGKLYGVVISGERAESVRSLSAGTVVSSGPYRGFGQVSIVKSNDGHTYVYGGMDGLSVKEGDRVAPGAALGFLGTDAVSGKAQLFFLVYKGDLAIDPAKAPRT
ncbi:MAG TPA: M23 family peptidase [Treponema sp.]|nr:MAG: hypothetical protein A2413_14190 [Treponema sp. RIFOXYC1_FULL_61_9]HCM26289.1 M23 family peptidase [Treponema sp.]